MLRRLFSSRSSSGDGSGSAVWLLSSASKSLMIDHAVSFSLSKRYVRAPLLNKLAQSLLFLSSFSLPSRISFDVFSGDWEAGAGIGLSHMVVTRKTRLAAFAPHRLRSFARLGLIKSAVLLSVIRWRYSAPAITEPGLWYLEVFQLIRSVDSRLDWTYESFNHLSNLSRMSLSDPSSTVHPDISTKTRLSSCVISFSGTL